MNNTSKGELVFYVSLEDFSQMVMLKNLLKCIFLVINAKNLTQHRFYVRVTCPERDKQKATEHLKAEVLADQ